MSWFFLTTALPFLGFYTYAAYQSRQYAKIAAQPGGLAFIAFCILVVKWVAHAIIFYTVGFHPTANTILTIVHVLITILLLVCVFGWRKEEGATYMYPSILAAIGAVIPIVIPFIVMGLTKNMDPGHLSQESFFTFLVGGVSSVLNLGSLVLMYMAVFGWRGYPQNVPTLTQAVESSSTSPGVEQADGDPKATTVEEPPGMFEKADFIPYVCGVMILGGFIIVPIVWGNFMDLSFEKSLFPSLLSCGVFAASHSKTGNFHFGRFIFLNIYVFFMIMRTMAKYGSGGGKPMFMAGGLLGFLVMAACGWAGIGIVRLIRKLFTSKS